MPIYVPDSNGVIKKANKIPITTADGVIRAAKEVWHTGANGVNRKIYQNANCYLKSYQILFQSNVTGYVLATSESLVIYAKWNSEGWMTKSNVPARIFDLKTFKPVSISGRTTPASRLVMTNMQYIVKANIETTTNLRFSIPEISDPRSNDCAWDIEIGPGQKPGQINFGNANGIGPDVRSSNGISVFITSRLFYKNEELTLIIPNSGIVINDQKYTWEVN